MKNYLQTYKELMEDENSPVVSNSETVSNSGIEAENNSSALKTQANRKSNSVKPLDKVELTILSNSIIKNNDSAEKNIRTEFENIEAFFSQAMELFFNYNRDDIQIFNKFEISPLNATEKKYIDLVNQAKREKEQYEENQKDEKNKAKRKAEEEAERRLARSNDRINDGNVNEDFSLLRENRLKRDLKKATLKTFNQKRFRGLKTFKDENDILLKDRRVRTPAIEGIKNQKKIIKKDFISINRLEVNKTLDLRNEIILLYDIFTGRTRNKSKLYKKFKNYTEDNLLFKISSDFTAIKGVIKVLLNDMRNASIKFDEYCRQATQNIIKINKIAIKRKTIENRDNAKDEDLRIRSDINKKVLKRSSEEYKIKSTIDNLFNRNYSSEELEDLVRGKAKKNSWNSEKVKEKAEELETLVKKAVDYYNQFKNLNKVNNRNDLVNLRAKLTDFKKILNNPIITGNRTYFSDGEIEKLRKKEEMIEKVIKRKENMVFFPEHVSKAIKNIFSPNLKKNDIETRDKKAVKNTKEAIAKVKEQEDIAKDQKGVMHNAVLAQAKKKTSMKPKSKKVNESTSFKNFVSIREQENIELFKFEQDRKKRLFKKIISVFKDLSEKKVIEADTLNAFNKLPSEMEKVKISSISTEDYLQMIKQIKLALINFSNISNNSQEDKIFANNVFDLVKLLTHFYLKGKSEIANSSKTRFSVDVGDSDSDYEDEENVKNLLDLAKKKLKKN